MPYIFAQAVKTSTVGIPMMRAMVMEYASDPACLYLDRQYMFGDNILVAPILNETGDAEYYLPEGTWTNIISGEEIQGGRYIMEKHGYFSLPALAKPNSIIAYGDFKGNFEYDYLEGANFVIYALEDGKTASATVYDKNANKVLELSATRNGNKIQISHTPADKAFTVTVSNGPSIKIAPNSNGKAEINL
jgi:alpha-D-xyloside xylohydrolase